MRFIHEILDASVHTSCEKTAIITKNKVISYGELQRESFYFGNYLLSQGVKKGDRVLLKLNNSIDLVCALIGVSRCGGVAVVINPSTTQYNLDYIVNDCKPKLLIHEGQELLKNSFMQSISIDVIREEIKKNKYNIPKIASNGLKERDVALLIYTSGSTGRPKAVVSSHSNVIFCTKTIAKALDIRPDDVIGNFLPLSFDYGLYQVFLSLYSAAKLALTDLNMAGIQLVKCLKEWKVTILPSMPHLTAGVIKLLPRYKNDIPLRVITNTGESLPSSYIKSIKELLPSCKIYPMYGLTECKRVSILTPSELENKPGSVGKSISQVHCYIVDEYENVLGPEQTGQLVVKGPNVMQGYWNNINLTSKKFKKNENGRYDTLYTGDLFKMDSDGYLYFVGRLDEMYKQNGFRVSPREIEEAFYNLELAEIAIVIPPDQSMEKSTLFIKTDKSLDYIKEKIKNRLEYYKIPDKIIILDEFPISTNKKIDKNKLREIRS